MLILDELSYAKHLLKDGLGDYPKLKDLIVIAKYLKYIGEETHNIKTKLNKICIDTDKSFNQVVNGWKITKSINTTKTYRLRTSFPVTITKAEIKSIQQFNNYNYEKILFVLLVYCKFLKYANTRIKPSIRLRNINEFFVNEKFSNIVKVARVSIKKAKRNQMLNEFYLAGLIDGTSYGSLKIKYVNENSDPCIIVTDLENIVLYYQRYKGEAVAGCQCGRLFLRKSNRHSLCRFCFQEQRLEKKKIYNKDYYLNVIN